MKLKDLLAGVSLIDISKNEEEEIQGIAYSSKDVQPGFLFAALKGEKKDGFEFIEEALLKGAEVILSEKPKPQNFEKNWIHVHDAREALALCSANFYSHPSQNMKVIGITGTKGKTTTTYLLEEILKKSEYIPGVIGTVSYRGPKINIPAQRTTPEAPDLQKMMREMLDKGVTHCLIEVSSHALELKRVLGIGFDIAIFSNLSGEHLDYHLSMERYFEAKKKLFFLNHKKRIAVINQDDPWGKKLISEFPGVITYGLEAQANIRGEKYKLAEKGIELAVKYAGGKFTVTSSLLGKPNLYNILASVATALTLNVPVSTIQDGITALKKIPGRFEKIENSFGLHIFVDYAHTDDALRNLLETAKELAPRRIILVFGAGGDRDKSKRERMGEVAGGMADWTILTNDNPRSEDPLSIISAIEKGIKKARTRNYKILPDRRKAIAHALSIGEKGDYILIAGKGHENYQIIQDKVFPFSDAEVIRSILKKMEAN
ncbi:MAG: UDP-N-acetylmuramoyl-L-alanyl-D-glutamate--2,6-diaminopimelate ligase [Candidatus Aminicenantes bacterium]|nr:MAG: UDP-N-acetylmuramoyl-L-alanyl-D-glutamate--2,6-diaminopimelate ligase [Candidatus Aminicenantes bacterium]